MFKKLFFVLLLLIFLAGVVAFLGVTGRFELGSRLLGLDQPEDLGVRYEDADYDRFVAKMDPSLAGGDEAPSERVERDGTVYVAVDATVTESEMSAYVARVIEERLPVRDVQVSFSSVHLSGRTTAGEIEALLGRAGASDGRTERVLSLFEEDASLAFSVHMDLVVSGGVYDVTLHSARIGRLGLPDTFLRDNQQEIDDMTRRLFESLGIVLEDFRAGDGEARLQGLIERDALLG